jgi:hypothetical protein
MLPPNSGCLNYVQVTAKVIRRRMCANYIGRLQELANQSYRGTGGRSCTEPMGTEITVIIGKVFHIHSLKAYIQRE